MRYTDRIAAQRLQAYYEKKEAYYKTMPVDERPHRPNDFDRVFNNFKKQVQQAFRPKN